ncbi:RcpC/CpaB family pilus assembly protein [Clostridioides difficile]|uniref:Flp pilus assembly protein CpaB n=1 Tax=Clostridioides difficile TaxID=1496 RepID=A0A386JC45_CLODI|nr:MULTISPECIES: RcpC/CpaB family pilus assembly protein [Clostridioides]EQF29815.1 putative flp pilus assembly protein CpaB [Clostridioides difficile CD160]AYD68730.1 Flp pilus assembly protein CpaB [Clostridioides difficile]MDI2882223.1 RcpC/CpaB family pilus assembly protein [Clostridioides difficile]MDI3004393.1 RcpC/CpaB family pilus assembly protein [Clostridioides difficile]MDN9956156.1 pilus assembly protein CpaB [Clostridioides difficile]
MKLATKRIIIGCSALLIGVYICFVSPYLQKMKSQTTFVRATQEIKKGEKISSTKVREIKTTDSESLPQTSIKTKDSVVGKYAITDINKDDNVLTTKISKNRVAENEYLYGLDGKNQAISFTIKNFAAGLSGKLETGDIISILAADYGEDKETLKPAELQYVRVLAVTNAKGSDKNDEKVQKGNEEENELPTTITVQVNDIQAKLLATLEENSKMHVTLVYRGTTNNAEKFIKKQEETINLLASRNMTTPIKE